MGQEISLCIYKHRWIIVKKNKLKDYLREKKPDIMCIVETKLPKGLSSALDNLNEYCTWRKDRGRKGEGRY